jgi:hypothetical protein
MEQDLGIECKHMVAIDDPKGIELADPVCLIDCLICQEQCKYPRIEKSAGALSANGRCDPCVFSFIDRFTNQWDCSLSLDMNTKFCGQFIHESDENY